MTLSNAQDNTSESIVEKITRRFNKLFPIALCLFDGALTGTNRPKVGVNVKQVVRTNTGIYQVVFNFPLVSANYIVMVTPSEERVVWVDNKDRLSFRITTENNSSTAADTALLNVVVFAPQ